MKLLNIILILSLFYSCSTNSLNSSFAKRDLASISDFKKSCKKVVSNFFSVDHKRIFEKLEDGRSLSLLEKKELKKYYSNIKNDSDRIRVSKTISDNETLSVDDLSIIKRYIEPVIYHKELAKNRSYRKRYLGGDYNIPITFGLEVELLLKDNPNIVKFYKVEGYEDSVWAALSIDEKLKISQKAIDKADAYEEIFIKLPGGHAKLPDTIFVEGHKTIEANGIIFDSIGETEDFLKYFSENIGRGSFQGHVAYKDYSKVDGVTGYIIFESDLAQLDNLERGYSRYLGDNSIIPSKSLVHHSLGPLSEDERLLFMVYEDAVNSGEAKNIKERIGNAKTILGPNFRPGRPYPEGFVGYEHRQYHKRFEDLLQGMDYQSRELEVTAGLKRYADFGELEQIDDAHLERNIKDYNLGFDVDDISLFFITAGEIIHKRSESHEMALGGAKGENRFFFPLKDWTNHPIVQKLPKGERSKVKKKIQASTTSFLEDVNKLVKNTDLDNIDDKTLIELQILNAKWGNEVNLSKYFRTYRQEVMNEVTARGPPVYHTTPRVEFAKQTSQITSKSGEMTNVYSMNSSLNKNIQYKQVKNNSAEIIFEPNTGKWGHVRIRIGEKDYSFNYNKSTTIKNFDLSAQKKDSRGFVYNVTKEQIEKMQSEIDNFYKSSAKYNIPPFDMFAKKYEISPSGSKFKINRDKKYGSGSANILNGKIVEVSGSKFLEAPNGTKIPVIEENGKMYIQSYTCASSAAHVINKFLGVDIGNYLGAKSIDDAIMNGQIANAPDYIFQYP